MTWAGNTMTAVYVQSDFLDILMDNALVTDVVLSQDVITDASAGAVLTIDVQYSREMLGTSTPLFNFYDGTVNTTLLSTGGEWLTSDLYRANYHIVDANAVQIPVGFNVTNAMDINGNMQMGHNAFDENLQVDMENPTITSMTPSPSLIDNSDIGSAMFSIEVDFSEPIDPSLSPTIDFLESDLSSALAMSSSSTWVDSDSYRFDFDVLQEPASAPLVDISIGNVSDVLGNPLEIGDVEDVFSIDIISSLGENDALGQILIYPNPIGQDQVVHVRFEKQPSDGQLTLVDALGRIMAQWDMANLDQGELIIETQILSAGTYLLQLTNDISTSSYRLVINKQ